VTLHWHGKFREHGSLKSGVALGPKNVTKTFYCFLNSADDADKKLTVACFCFLIKSLSASRVKGNLLQALFRFTCF